MGEKDDPLGIVQEMKITTKCYVQKPDLDVENETHEILWDLGIQTNHLILFRRPDK